MRQRFWEFIGSAFSLHCVQSSLTWLVELRRYPKRYILVANDLVIQFGALWIGVAMRYGDWFPPLNLPTVAVMTVVPFLGVAWLFWFRFYRNVTRFMGGRTINTVAIAIAASTLTWTLLIVLSGVSGVPRLALAVYLVLSTLGIWGSRQIAGWLLRLAGVHVPKAETNRTPVIIYGAGQAALALARALERSDRYVAIGLTDRKASLWGQYVGGYKVYRPERLRALIERLDVKEILIALEPEVSRSERLAIIREVETLGIIVRKLPGVDDFASGRISVSDLRPVDAKDLLGREPVPPDQALMRGSVTGRVVMVTGAGGSIGSELCRQLVDLAPKKLVLLDAAEGALFQIHQQLVDHLSLKAADGDGCAVELIMVLGSVRDRTLVDATLKLHGVNTIFHAAAHKHVPIIEANVIEGLDNNTFGTWSMAEAAREAGVDRFVLVSTDKAVRPTNVMGASKRLAEIILQAMASEGRGKTVFTIVRFGNVLDSSGSVVRRFRHQIAAGGPVTVTHRDMIRYFMSIPEAASLVIQAGTMAKGGEVFVLDMGEPVSIDSLARSMINLAGLKVRDEAQPDGDISIAYVGLRPGEKLREELLISDTSRGTEHPRIRTSLEPFLTFDLLRIELAALRIAMEARNLHRIYEILSRNVEGYRVPPQQRATPLADSDSLGYAWHETPSKALH